MNSNVPEEHAASAYLIAAIQGCIALSIVVCFPGLDVIKKTLC
jgi:hypothetical protein